MSISILTSMLFNRLKCNFYYWVKNAYRILPVLEKEILVAAVGMAIAIFGTIFLYEDDGNKFR
jgi:hypothetical protein